MFKVCPVGQVEVVVIFVAVVTFVVLVTFDVMFEVKFEVMFVVTFVVTFALNFTQELVFLSKLVPAGQLKQAVPFQ